MIGGRNHGSVWRPTLGYRGVTNAVAGAQHDQLLQAGSGRPSPGLKSARSAARAALPGPCDTKTEHASCVVNIKLGNCQMDGIEQALIGA